MHLSTRTCISCGQQWGEAARYCGRCGAPAARLYELAGWWRRVAAGLIDLALFVFAGMIFGLAGAIAYFDGGAGVGIAFVWLGWHIYSVMAFADGGGIGMQAMGLRLVDANTGGEPRVRRALIRFIVSAPSLWAFGLGYFWMLWDPKRQTWHDKAAGTLVVHANR